MGSLILKRVGERERERERDCGVKNKPHGQRHVATASFILGFAQRKPLEIEPVVEATRRGLDSRRVGEIILVDHVDYGTNY